MVSHLAMMIIQMEMQILYGHYCDYQPYQMNWCIDKKVHQ